MFFLPPAGMADRNYTDAEGEQKAMRDLKYHLQKEDYMDWIHWNVGRQNQRKVHIITLIIYLVFLVLYIGGNIVAKKPPQVIITSVLMMGALGAFMFYTISAKHQAQVVWKRSGLRKLEKTDGFPTVHLTVREDGIKMEVTDELCKEYSYADIKEIREIDRLFLLAAASDGTWQFVAKSAFENEEQIKEFKAFMEEKIEDAKENPEKYRKIEEEKEKEEAPLQRSAEESISGGDGEEVEITPVDTSSMGKIGKMAHIMAAMEERQAQEEVLRDGGQTKDQDEAAGQTEDQDAAAGQAEDQNPEPDAGEDQQEDNRQF